MKQPPEVFETERLQLRRLDVGMSEAFHALFEKNFDILKENAVLPVVIAERQKNTPQNVASWIMELDKDWELERRYAWAVFQKTDVKTPVGYFEVGVENIFPTIDGVKGDLCYWLDQDLRRQGVMKEIFSKAKELFVSCGWSHLEIEALSNNTGSVRLAEKLGFTRYGTGLGAYTGPVSLLYQLKLRPVEMIM